MRTRGITIRTGLATTAALIALSAPAGADSVQDLRLPDWRSPLATTSQGLTTPASNARDTTPADASAALSQERYYSSYGTPGRAPAQSTRASAPAADGFNWDDAAIGAGGALAILILGGGGMTLLHRRDGRSQPRAIVS